jgi:hypothetical protein
MCIALSGLPVSHLRQSAQSAVLPPFIHVLPVFRGLSVSIRVHPWFLPVSPVALPVSPVVHPWFTHAAPGD